MADQIEPYVPANAGDIIRAADWNQAQIKAREALATHEQKANEALAAHDHAHGDGQPIPREGIAQNAIDGSRIDPNAEFKLKSLELSGPLKVDARDILDEIDKLLASVPGSGERDFAARNLVVDGTAQLRGSKGGVGLRVIAGGKVGIGTPVPEATLQIVDKNQGPNGALLIIGPTNQANLRLGYDADYSWVQAHGGKPLSLNPIGNNVGIGTIAPAGKLEVNGTAVISDGNSFATGKNFMAAGSLTVGSINANYGGGSNWNSSTAGLLLETSANTEIAVHDSKTRVASLMYYEGDAANRITIGRDMGWGAISRLTVNGGIAAGNSDLYFTKTDHNHTGFGNTAGYAAIENAANYGALMILGRAGTDVGRKVELWDYLGVNGTCKATNFVGPLSSGNGKYSLVMQDDRNLVCYAKGAGAFWASSTSVSDINLKKDLRPINNALEKLQSLRGTFFSWKEEVLGKGEQIGVVAQEVEKVFPGLVSTINGRKLVDYQGLIPVLIEAMKEQQELISSLQQQVWGSAASD